MTYFIKRTSLALLLGFCSVSTAHAQSDKNICSIYGSIGESMVDFMLPLTLKNFIELNTGGNPELEQELTSALESSLSVSDARSFVKLNEEEQTLLGEAAGGTAVTLLMSGHAADAKAIKTFMQKNCEKHGYKTIIAQQKKANNATLSLTEN